MRTSLFAFGWDVLDGGPEALLDDLAGRAGVGGVTLAAAYHAARDLFPHARGRRVRFLRGGEAAFAPDAGLWAGGRLAPLEGPAVLDELVAAAGRRGMHVDAWTVFLHVDREHDLPDGLAEETCFGDPLPTQLCPSAPGVRDYAVRLATDVARRGVRAVVAESLHFHGLEHGFHHERYFVRLGDAERLLLGMCFCSGCLAAAAAAGVDGTAVRDAARAHVERALADLDAAGDDAPLDRAGAAALLDGLLGPYLAVREATLAALVADVAAACRAGGAELVFLDSSGAAKGYATGRPTGGPAPEIAWRFGVDVPAVAGAAGALGAIAYAADPARVALDLDAYRALTGPDVALEAVVRPVLPDTDGVESLAAKVAACRARDVRALGFYHYGLVPLAALDRVRGALGYQKGTGTF